MDFLRFTPASVILSVIRFGMILAVLMYSKFRTLIVSRLFLFKVIPIRAHNCYTRLMLNYI